MQIRAGVVGLERVDYERQQKITEFVDIAEGAISTIVVHGGMGKY